MGLFDHSRYSTYNFMDPANSPEPNGSYTNSSYYGSPDYCIDPTSNCYNCPYQMADDLDCQGNPLTN